MEDKCAVFKKVGPIRESTENGELAVLYQRLRGENERLRTRLAELMQVRTVEDLERFKRTIL